MRRVLSAVAAAIVLPIAPVMTAPMAYAAPIAATGFPIYMATEGGSIKGRCTLGPLVERGGRYAFLTSSHCAINGKRTPIYMGNNIRIGTITRADDDSRTSRDYALVAVKQEYVNKRFFGKTKQAFMLAHTELTPEMRLCKVGATTGMTCGNMTKVLGDGTIDTNIPADHGDSGGPVVVANDSGVGIVGLISRGSKTHVQVTPILWALIGLDVKLVTFND